MTIKGPAEAIEQAKTAIDVLYHKVSKGIEINEQEVKAAVRMSNNGADSEEATNLSDIVLKTKKRHIYPRSATQAAYIQEMMKTNSFSVWALPVPEKLIWRSPLPYQ